MNGEAPGMPPLLPCPVCSEPLAVRSAHGRKSGKPFIMLVCPQDGRHLRAFITDQGYVRQVLDRLEAAKTPEVKP